MVARKKTVVTRKRSLPEGGHSLGENQVKAVKKFIKNNPITFYLGASVAGVLLLRWGYRYYRDHPEFKDFIRDNLDLVEEKIKDYRSEHSQESRH